MIVILSPAKDMKVLPENKAEPISFTLPQYLEKASVLVSILRKMNMQELSELMNISDKLTELNFIRLQNWVNDHVPINSSPSLLSYTGEVFRGLNSSDFSIADMEYSQNVLRILSGLYGILRPLDLIQPYRLEMMTGLKFRSYKNLYEFWRGTITNSLEIAIAKSPGEKVLINLASIEYSSSINLKKLNYTVITPSFYEEKSGKLKIVTVYTKRARGLMTRFIIKNRLKNSEDLKAFTEEGYYFENQLSTENNWLFVR